MAKQKHADWKRCSEGFGEILSKQGKHDRLPKHAKRSRKLAHFATTSVPHYEVCNIESGHSSDSEDESHSRDPTYPTSPTCPTSPTSTKINATINLSRESQQISNSNVTYVADGFSCEGRIKPTDDLDITSCSVRYKRCKVHKSHDQSSHMRDDRLNKKSMLDDRKERCNRKNQHILPKTETTSRSFQQNSDQKHSRLDFCYKSIRNSQQKLSQFRVGVGNYSPDVFSIANEQLGSCFENQLMEGNERSSTEQNTVEGHSMIGADVGRSRNDRKLSCFSLKMRENIKINEDVLIDEDFDDFNDDNDANLVDVREINKEMKIREDSPILASYSSNDEDFTTDPVTSQAISVESSDASTQKSPDPNSRKASDWIKLLECEKTPEKERHIPDQADGSAKKSKKFKRNGLAQRLDRLTLRDKSRRTEWRHRIQTAVTNSQKDKMVRLVAISVDASLSVIVARCRKIPGDEIQDITSESCQSNNNFLDTCQSNFSDGMPRACQSKSIGNTDTCQSASIKNDQSDAIDSSRETYVTGLFSKKCRDHHLLAAGSCVQIHPPWQRMDLTGRSPLILADYYQVTNQAVDVGASTSHKRSWTFRCPCVSDPSIPKDKCPAVKNLVKTDIVSLLRRDRLGESGDQHAPITTHLHTVSRKNACHLQRAVVATISECLEHHTHQIDHSVSLVALVHRRFTYQDETTGQIRHALLLTDRLGVFCLAQIAADLSVPLNGDTPDRALGSVTINEFSVDGRILREKNLALFSVIDRLWSRRDDWLSRPTSVSQEDLPPSPPMFCYEITTHDTQSLRVNQTCSHDATDRLHRRDDVGPAPEDGYTKLYEIMALMMTDISRRVDCVGHVIARIQSRLYITDVTISGNVVSRSYVIVDVDPTCVPVTDANWLVLRDVFIHSGSLFADAYTSISRLSCVPPPAPCHPNLPTLSAASQSQDLVTIHGCVRGLTGDDEACCWEECATCACDQLYQKHPNSLYCPRCQTLVTTRTRYKMAVLVTFADFPSDGPWTVTVELSEASILKLLPPEQPPGGYDINCVLNKLVGPVMCWVSQKNDTQHFIVLKELHDESSSQNSIL